METIINKKNVLIAVAIVIVFAAGGSFYLNNKELKTKLSSEKLRSENLLTQKIQLDKSLELSKKDLADLQATNGSMEKMIKEINQKIVVKNSEIDKLKAQNASLKTIQKKYDELEVLKKQRDQEISELNKSLALVKTENQKLNDRVALATKTNSELSTDNTILKAIISDNYRTEALRGKNEKLTVNARKTNKLIVSFDLPGTLATNDIYFKVFTPEGNEFSSNKDLAATLTFEENGDDLLASAVQPAPGPASSRRIEMTFKPKQKLSEGIYRFNLYHGDRFLGSTQLRLK